MYRDIQTHIGGKELKLLIIGHGRHGKDTVAEILSKKANFKFVSSSLFMAERVIFPWFQKEFPNLYQTVSECYDDRHNHRSVWYDLINGYNKKPTLDFARLGRAIFEDYDIYAGLRNTQEFQILKQTKTYDICVWVDASQRLPLEDKSSMTLEPWMADYIIDNNGTVEELEYNVDIFHRYVLKGERNE